MRKRMIYTLLAISLFAMLGTGCSKKAEQKSETTKSAAQTETVGASIGDQTADTEKKKEAQTEMSDKSSAADADDSSVTTSAQDAQEELTEVAETAAEDSWEDSADGWD